MASICGCRPPTTVVKSERKASLRSRPEVRRAAGRNCSPLLLLLLLLRLPYLVLKSSPPFREATGGSQKQNISCGFHGIFCTIMLFSIPVVVLVRVSSSDLPLGSSKISSSAAVPISTASNMRSGPPYCIQAGTVSLSVACSSVRRPACRCCLLLAFAVLLLLLFSLAVVVEMCEPSNRYRVTPPHSSFP